MTMALTNAAQVDTVIRATEVFAVDEILERGEHFHVAATVGVGPSPGIPMDTGLARSGLCYAPNSPPKPLVPINLKPRRTLRYTPLDVLGYYRQMAGFRLGDTWRARDEVPHAYIVAVVGRRRDRRGRMIGSRMAPDGTIKQAIRYSELVVTRGRR